MHVIQRPRIAIVTAADAAYFHLLKGLLQSCTAGALTGALPVCVLDLGLTDEQTAFLRNRGVTLVAPGWDVAWAGRDQAPSCYRAMTARPYLPKYFPDYDVYLWIDSDAWVQDDSVLEWFIAAALRGQLAVTLELDRAYTALYKRGKLWGLNQRAFAWCYGLRAGDRFGRNPILNSGVFALAADAPHWQLWADAHRRALTRKRWFAGKNDQFYFFIAEQTALNWVVFADKAPATFLPTLGNWLCVKGKPMWSHERQMLVEPHAPHAALGVVHLAGKGMKERVWDLQAIDGPPVRSRLTWDEVMALKSGDLAVVSS